MSPERHRIQRQVFEFSVGAGVPVAGLQESLARLFHDELVPELEVAFDRAAGTNQLLRLDRLEIDLGVLVLRNWRHELRERLAQELAETLAGHSPDEVAPRAAFSVDADVLRQYLYFLRHGRLPWWGSRAAAEWRGSLTDTMLAGTSLRDTLRGSPDARARFVDSLDARMLDAAVAAWCAVPGAAKVIDQLEKEIADATLRPVFRRRAWVHIVDAASTPAKLPAGGPDLLRKLLAEMAEAAEGGEGGAGAGVLPQAGDAGNHVAAASAPGLPAPWDTWLIEARGGATTSPLPARRLGSADREEAVSARSVAPTRRPAPLAPAEEATYLHGAGVILLHPFLETLFRDRALLEGRDFRDETARERAVHLVGLLTFGRREVPEHDLVLAKLLCGMPLDQAIKPADLADADVAACDELLGAALLHWSALRSGSPDWLRAQFLLREAKLETVDEGFRITVERRAQDVLLAKLPWGFGVVGLPWLEARIFVRWLD
jgi:hypothetical protein